MVVPKLYNKFSFFQGDKIIFHVLVSSVTPRKISRLQRNKKFNPLKNIDWLIIDPYLFSTREEAMVALLF